MKQRHFNKTKGQSAIEYLMTYGWMLLVVAIVGGAIFATVQGQCTQSVSGFTGGDVIVENFGTTSTGNLQMEVRNGGADTLEINSATMVNPDGTDATLNSTASTTSIDVGSSATVQLGSGYNTDPGNANYGPLESSDGCNDFDLEFNYNMSSLTDQQSQGTLTDSIEFN
jgi:hypothetical protein